jgi:hypothetical protein
MNKAKDPKKSTRRRQHIGNVPGAGPGGKHSGYFGQENNATGKQIKRLKDLDLRNELADLAKWSLPSCLPWYPQPRVGLQEAV